jgi:hypothetical protein
MRLENKTMRVEEAPITGDTPQYATRGEVEAGLAALNASDHAKLAISAAFFCKERRLALSVIEPQELLSEAVLKTLQCEEGKRWSKKVSLLKHLDRAMENISGHLVEERTKIIAFSDGLQRSCPAAILTDGGSVVIQGYTLSVADRSQLADPAGEDFVRMPLAVFEKIARQVLNA